METNSLFRKRRLMDRVGARRIIFSDLLEFQHGKFLSDRPAAVPGLFSDFAQLSFYPADLDVSREGLQTNREITIPGKDGTT